MDKSWAISEIDEFLNLSERVTTPPNTLPHQRGIDTDVAAQAGVVRQILDRALPGWPREPDDGRPSFLRHKWEHLRGQAAQAKTMLEREAELRDKLGDGAPVVDMGGIHPWAWNDATAARWRIGHFDDAVAAAARQINTETQHKVNRSDVSETTLFQQAFSADPPKEGKPRLRFDDPEDSLTYRSRLRGAACLGEALYAGVRNPLAHHSHELDEHVALDQLASFSLLARWVDDAHVVTV